LAGGEDYELLFTVHPDGKPAMERLLLDLGTPVTEIGVVTEERCLTVLNADGSELNTGKRGYDHFSS
jgi:thiamine-monophosphate kinase